MKKKVIRVISRVGIKVFTSESPLYVLKEEALRYSKELEKINIASVIVYGETFDNLTIDELLSDAEKMFKGPSAEDDQDKRDEDYLSSENAVLAAEKACARAMGIKSNR